MKSNPTSAQNQYPAFGSSTSAPRPSTSFYEDHPLAGIFPLMPADDLAALAANIREHGLEVPLMLYERKVLDGRNRWRACQLAGVEPHTVQFPTDRDPLAFVLSANLHRRHLTTSQRALIAARIATLSHGGNRKDQGLILTLDPSIDEAADKLSVCRSTVKAARTVLQDEAQTRAVESGQKTVHTAAREIRAARVAQTTKPIPRDDTDREISEALWPLWNRKAEVAAVLADLSRLRQTLQAARETGDLLFAPTNLREVLVDLEHASSAVALSALYAVCPICDARDPEKCPTCHGRAFLCQDEYSRCPIHPEEATP